MEFLNNNLTEDVKQFLMKARRQRRAQVVLFHHDRFDEECDVTRRDTTEHEADFIREQLHSGTPTVYLAASRYTHYTAA